MGWSWFDIEVPSMTKTSRLTKDVLKDFFFAITNSKNSEELWLLLIDFCKPFGTKHHRVSVYHLEVPIGPESFLYVKAEPDGPGSWAHYYIENKLYEHDRSFHLAFNLSRPTLEWAEMDRRTRKGTEANRVFVDMQDFGIGNGLLISKSCKVQNHTVLLGIAGPSKTMKQFQAAHYQTFLHVLRLWNSCFLDALIAEGKIERIPDPDIHIFKAREREILRLFSQGKTTSGVAASLNISPGTINATIKRLKNLQHIPSAQTRDGLVSYALRTKQID